MSRKFVEVWSGELLSEAAGDQNCWSLLNQAEKARAKKFTRKDLQNKYVSSRIILRKILSSYLNIEPQDIEIATAEYGKPYLVEHNLNFNLSHKDNQFVIVVSNIEHIGIDLEYCQQRVNLTALVNKCFANSERLYWNNLDEKQKVVEFYRFWVRKEAFVKAVGKGIALGLNQCVVNPLDQSGFLDIPKGNGLVADWKIKEIVLEQDQVCALVVKNEEYEYKQMQWN